MSGGQTALFCSAAPADKDAAPADKDAAPPFGRAPPEEAPLVTAAAAATAEKLVGGEVGELFDLKRRDWGLMLLLAEEAEEEKAWFD